MKRIFPTVCVVMVVGCVKAAPARPPPEAFITLAGKKASYRAWARAEDLCAIEPAQFTGEQQALSALLSEWLHQTSMPADGAWDDQQLQTLEDGARVLPPALDLQREAIEKAGKLGCPFTGLAPMTEVNAKAAQRVKDAPALVQQGKALRAAASVAKWKADRPGLESAAKEANCLTKAKPPAPILYFAAEDETGLVQWLFCDGSKVSAAPGASPTWQPDPSAKKPKKQPDPKVWLDLAEKFPAQNINRAPKAPAS